MDTQTVAQTFSVYQVLGLIGWILGGILLFRNAGQAILDIVKVFKAPNDAQDARLAELEEHRKHVDDCLKKDKAALADNHEMMIISLRAQRALISHALDGNNFDKIKKSEEEIEEYLINR